MTVRRRFNPGTTVEDLRAYMEPFALRLGYIFNTDEDFVREVLESELEILERDGDIYCPCRVRSGDPKEDALIVCPCIPFFSEQFSGLRKCWCGLFIRHDVEDGLELLGVIAEPEGPVAVPVARAEDIPDGQTRHVKVGKRDICLARVGDEFFALSNVCRHAFAPLSDGWLDGHHAICPWHGWRYDVRDGTTDHPGADVKTYQVAVIDGFVYLTP